MDDPCIIPDSVDRDPECCDPEEHKPVVLTNGETLIANDDNFWMFRISTGNRHPIWATRHWAFKRYQHWTCKPIRLRDLSPMERLLYGIFPLHRPEPKVASQPWKNQRKQRKCDSRPFKH